ncbi:hypothetical protein DBW30_21540 [Salmonella enterica subsp. enterica]|nr:hypothetical protein [Salmonella enterica subsp. enterica]
MASNVANPYFILPTSLIPVGITTQKPATIVLVFQMNSKKVGALAPDDDYALFFLSHIEYQKKFLRSGQRSVIRQISEL